MMRTSIWVTLGIGLFYTLNTEAVVLGGGTQPGQPPTDPPAVFADFGDFKAVAGIKKNVPRAGGIVITDDPGPLRNALRKPAPHPATAPQSEPPEIFDSQDPLDLTIIWGSGDGDPNDDEAN